MRAAWLLILLAACSAHPTAPARRASAPPPTRPFTPPLLPAQPLPRVVEVLTAAGDVRDAVWIGDSWWLATAGGLVSANGALEEQARVTTLDGLPSNDVWAVAADGARLWAATSAGLVSARLEGGRLVELRVAGEAEGLPSRRVRALALVDNVLYAGTWGSGVARLGSDGRFTPLPLGPSGANVTRLRSDGRRLWVATAGGVARLDDPARATRAATDVRWWSARDGLPDDLVWDVRPNPRGALVATAGGLAQIVDDRLLPGEPVERRALSLQSAVTAAFGAHAHAIVDGGARALVCGEDGARLASNDGRVIATLRPVGLPAPDLTALAVGADALYVGTFDHGVARVRFDRDDGTLDITPVDGLIDARINALAVRSDGDVEELWVGTARGATRVRAGRVTHFTAADGLPDDHVNAILAEPDAVRLGTTRGMAEIGPGGVAKLTLERGLPTARLMALARGGDGALWLGSAHGAAQLAVCPQGRPGCDGGGSWTVARALRGELPDDFVTAVTAAGDDMWIGTYASGLARHSGGRWMIFREPEIPSNWVNPGALATFAERLWVGTVERGLAVSPPLRAGDDEGRWTTLSVADGLPAADVTALAADDDGLWVATRGGLARVVLPAAVSAGAR